MPLLEDELVGYLTPAGAPRQLLARSGLAQRRIEPVDIRLDLLAASLVDDLAPHHLADIGHCVAGRGQLALHAVDALAEQDRKSTRLNSSHLVISYAVFCLKKKKKQK